MNRVRKLMTNKKRNGVKLSTDQWLQQFSFYLKKYGNREMATKQVEHETGLKLTDTMAYVIGDWGTGKNGRPKLFDNVNSFAQQERGAVRA